MSKRTDYISRDEYFMSIALISAQRSKDPVTQIGACIVNDKKNIVGIGYNGFPKGCSDEEFPREKTSLHSIDDKRTYVVHAEVNAILNSHKDLEKCTIYVLLFPCNECTKMIIQSGIKKVVYLSDEDAHKDHTKAAKRMFDAAGVEYTKFNSSFTELKIKFDIHY